MALTNQVIVNRARRLISDSTATYRWVDTTACLYLSDGLREIWRRAPHAFYVSSIVTTVPAEVGTGDLASSSVLRDEYTQSLVHFICWRCLSEDSEDANNRELANMHWQHFLAALS